MLQIKENQEVEIDSLISYRGKMRKNELESITKDMEKEVQAVGGTQIGKPITAIFGFFWSICIRISTSTKSPSAPNIAVIGFPI